MNLKNFTTGSIGLLYGSVREALAADDLIPDGQPKPHEVRATPDWRRWADQLEAELEARGETFDRIKW